MSENKHTIIYKAEDIQQYLSGKLTPLQMNAMEKAALDDPFLAEAIEGFENIPVEEWKDGHAALKKQLAEKNTGAIVIPIHRSKNNWWKVAAAVLVIGSTTAISYWLINKKEQPQIAKTETNTNSVAPKIMVPETSRVNIMVSPAATEKIAEDKNGYREEAAKNPALAENELSDTTFVYKPSAAKPTANAGFEKPVTGGYINTNPRSETVAVPSVNNAAPVFRPNANSNSAEVNNYKAFNKTNSATQELFYDKTAGGVTKETTNDQPLNRSFYAQVVGPDNTPLPFANISIKSESFGTYADVKGNFRLVSSDSVLNVEVKSAGYQSKQYTLKSNLLQNKIILVEDDMASKQKTVINSNMPSKNKISRRATLIKDSIVNVEPADGWDNYSTYVDNNIEIPDEILKGDIHGQVELSFDVKANGTITNIKVNKSLCDNCDEVAKRLIEQGPQWKVKKGKNGKGKITVQF